MVKPLPEPIADPSDPTGATALEKVPAQIGESYPMSGLSAKIESIRFSSEISKGKAPKKDDHYLFIIGTAKNTFLSNFGFVWARFALGLIRFFRDPVPQHYSSLPDGTIYHILA